LVVSGRQMRNGRGMGFSSFLVWFSGIRMGQEKLKKIEVPE